MQDIIYDYYVLATPYTCSIDERLVMVNDDQRLKDLYELLYSSTSLLLYSNVDEALYDIVWYGPLMVELPYLLSINICFYHFHERK